MLNNIYTFSAKIRGKNEKNMKHIQYIAITVGFMLMGSVSLIAQEKHLILAEGNFWKPLLAPNLIENRDYIQKLPFSGFVMVGNSFTKEVMREGVTLKYSDVWSEVKGLKGLYTNKHNFMQINIDFPADFWDYNAWNRVSDNFAIVAKVAKDLNFTGIIFDDEPYTLTAHKMSNFKFPSRSEINRDSKRWEIKGSEEDWVDKKAYRNPEYNFKEHMEKVTYRFKRIMQSMAKAYPHLTILVYNGASFAHVNSNKKDILITDVGLPREHEYKGAIFAGLQQGLDANVTLHDMGESYRYRTDNHFKRAYQWRKYDIATDASNRVDTSFQWNIPKKQRASWSTDIGVGFMVFNKGQDSNNKEYETKDKSTLKDIKSTLQKALKYSDKYVIYYAQDQDWLLPNQKHPLKKGWMEMIKKLP